METTDRMEGGTASAVERRRRAASGRVRWIAALVAASFAFAVLPAALSDYGLYVLDLALTNVLLAAGLNVVIGVARQFALFSGALSGIGAYTVALAQSRFGVPFPAALLLAVLAATAASGAASLLAWRAGGLYLAMITFGFGEIFQFVLVHADWLTKGPDGLAVARPVIAGYTFATPAQLFRLAFPVTVLAVLALWFIEAGRIGRRLVALGDNERALAAIGYDARLAKTAAFLIQGGCSGLAGGLFAVVVGFIDPYSFGLDVTLQQLTAIAVGGLGSLVGAVAGALLLTGIDRVLADFPGLRELGYGAALLLVFLFAPNGVAALLQRRGDRA